MTQRLKDMLQLLKQPEVFEKTMETFLTSRKQLIDSTINERDRETLSELLVEDLQNQVFLQSEIDKINRQIANVALLKEYVQLSEED